MSEAPGDDDAPDENAEGAEEERIGLLARLIPVTTPGCASCLTVVFLVTTLVTVWLVFWLDPSNIPWRFSYSWWRIFGILALLVMIPYIVYHTISLWLEGTPKAFPEVDQAWRAGMQALAANEISIDSAPIFLITGSSGEAQERALMNASGLRLSVEGVPQGPAPIHWYANSEAIYLFCTDSSWTSALASLREEIASENISAGLRIETPLASPSSYEPPSSYPSSGDYQVVDSAGLNATATTTAPEPLPPSLPGPQATNQGIRGTLELNEFVTPKSAKPPATVSNKPPVSPPGSFRGTLMLGDAATPALTAQEITSPSKSLPPPPTRQSNPLPPSHRPASPTHTLLTGEVDALSTKKPVLVSHQYSAACLQELQYLGLLIRRSRQPLCGINGVLSLIQVESIHSSQAELEELQRAIRGDLDIIREACEVKVPVSALVVGLEKERGFRELIARVGRERAMSQRFGRRFDIQAIPAKDQMVALATHLCGVFEDWVYTLFREEQALTRPGNTRLYELLSKVRCGWKGRLGDILAGGFGCEPTKQDEASAVFFSGCYFAATGETPERQAFVKGVIEKLGEEQELIEWTPEALRANQRQKIAANLGAVVALGLLASLIIMYLLLG